MVERFFDHLHTQRSVFRTPLFSIAWKVAVFAWLMVLSRTVPHLFEAWHAKGHEGELWTTLLLLPVVIIGGGLSSYIAENTPVPSFVIAILIGMLAQPLFAPIIENGPALLAIVTGAAAVVLFGGGIETPFANFRRLFTKIAMLALPGVLFTAVALSYTTEFFATVFGVAISATVAVLLASTSASTDPAAIIPSLEGVRFKKRDVKDIVISESALNDVTGTIITAMLLSQVVHHAPFAGIWEGYSTLMSGAVLAGLASKLFFGVVVGLAGYVLLEFISFLAKSDKRITEAEKGLFLIVPVLAYPMAEWLGGSGFLAAFVAGLLFHAKEHLKPVEEYVADITNNTCKPAIFILLGALVDVQSLVAFAPLGITTALVFMFVLRPAMVFLFLGMERPFTKARLTVRELIFVSFVRETGAIPAVLLVTIASTLTGIAGLVEIGMWIILATLVIQPPLTPFVAKSLGLTVEDIHDQELPRPAHA